MLTALEEKEILQLSGGSQDVSERGYKKTSFGTETDRPLSKLPESGRKEQIKSFQNVFDLASKKLAGHLDKHPAYAYHKAICVFDP